jgi:hypothetical protein
MRVLLIHPEDDLQGEPWASIKWDRVIDLGRSGAASYASAAVAFGCQVPTLSEFFPDFQGMRRVRELLSLGMGRLVDGFGLDWWELASIEVHQELGLAVLLGHLARTLNAQDEVHVTRPCLQAEVLRLLLGSRVQTFEPTKNRPKTGAQHYIRVLRKFSSHQLLEIFWDKTDSGYQIRGRFNIKRRPQPSGLVLLPSSYVNVSRTAVAYAQSLPDAQFLLVVTRRSGWLEKLPANVSGTWLRRYASVRDSSRKGELADLVKRWKLLRSELMETPEFRTLAELRCFDDFSERFARGLEIRDAWRNVFDREHVQSVICADDSNPSTHIPLLLAKHRGLSALACHHGALDGHNLFKRNHADARLAKGKMEEDYLVMVCGIASERVEIGAPALSLDCREDYSGREKLSIVFFSEPYEVTGGRAREFYSDILPSLADLALARNRELIVKLHPSESFAERSRIIKQLLNPAQMRVTRVVDGPLQSALLDKTWFGITGMSTVVVECALYGIPCFLCSWIEVGNYRYVDQFTRFALGYRLNDPGELQQIPEILQSYTPSSSEVRENCWTQIEAQRLRSLLKIVPVSADETQRDIAKSVR